MIEEVKGVEASEDIGNDDHTPGGDLHHEMKMQVDQSQILLPDNIDQSQQQFLNPAATE